MTWTWCGNFGGAQAGHGHLVEQGLEEVVVAPIDESDANGLRLAEHLGGVEPCESAAHDDDVFHVAA